MRNEINVGLVGFGLAGRVFHAPVIQSVPNLKLRKVVERHSEHSRQKYPAVQVVRDAMELFADPAIDLVVITTPNDSHFDHFRNVRQPTWREEAGPGRGILFDLGSHLIDQAQVLFGLPQLITADIRVQRDGSQIADNFELILHYDNLKVTLKAGML